MLENSRYISSHDVETTGFDPLRNCVISYACIVHDREKDIKHEFYEECRPDSLTPNYEHPNMKGFIITTWNDEAERVHKMSWRYSNKQQHPMGLCVKFTKFISGINKEAMPFLFHHSSADFDYRMVKCMMYKNHDKLYFWFLRHFPYELTLDTAKLAKAYISQNKAQLKLIKDNETKINKPRKRAASKKNLDNWNEQINSAKNELKGKILFEGYSLDKLCRGLGVELEHHNALSDAKAVLPVFEFFNDNAV
tara:strand:- start:12411 stop:13163 length:753 start_codon:yes stop_codon:yes gene_type:complete